MSRRLRVQASFDPAFDRTSGAYDVLGGIREQVRCWTDWPDVSAYDGWTSGLTRAAGRPLLYRDVGRATVLARGGYDPFIAETGLIPTRSRSWHDFFNACIWSRLPRAKLAVHTAQLEECSVRRRAGPPVAGRTRRQDWLTHFDECGVVVVSDRQELLERIGTLAWHDLFVDGRADFAGHAVVVCFGHGTLEALREPYPGLMGKALLRHVPEGTLPSSPEETRRQLDDWLAAVLSARTFPRLHALPVLGLPGWHAANEHPSFYDNAEYFRTRPGSLPALTPADAPYAQPNPGNPT